MKTLIHSLALLISLSLLLCAKAASPAPVLDIDGKRVRAGVKYYILPVVRGRGGGLTLGSRGNNNSCPLNVRQEQLEVSRGLPLTFSPVDKKRIIRESTDMNIKFSASSICIQSNVWQLDAYDDAAKKYFIAADGVEGNPGRTTIGNWFKIEKSGDYYKLVFCPTVCNICKVICKEIGIHIESGGKRFLALTDVDPFFVFFKRA